MDATNESEDPPDGKYKKRNGKGERQRYLANIFRELDPRVIEIATYEIAGSPEFQRYRKEHPDDILALFGESHDNGRTYYLSFYGERLVSVSIPDAILQRFSACPAADFTELEVLTDPTRAEPNLRMFVSRLSEHRRSNHKKKKSA